MINNKTFKSLLAYYLSRWRSTRHIKAHIQFPNMDFYEALTRTTYQKIFGAWPDIENPKSISEKMCWLKVHDKRAINGVVADKWRFRSYVEKFGYKEMLPKLLAVYENVDDIEFEKLPPSYALKVSNGSSWNIIKSPDTSLDPKNIKAQLKRWVTINWADHKGEWYYASSKPTILLEEYMDSGGGDLPDYKLFVFNGHVKIVQYCEGRQASLKSVFLTPDWEAHPFTYKKFSSFDGLPSKPSSLNQMIDVAEKLGEIFPLLRVDFYIWKDKPIIGELSLNPVGGYPNFEPVEWNEKIGDWLELPDAEVFKSTDSSNRYSATYAINGKTEG